MPGGLARVRSKEQIHTMERSPLMRHNRYGASAIIEAGREESQRMLMERYHRIDATNEKNNGAGILGRPHYSKLV